ncbi:MAG: heparinase II/III-family protein [Candidatus Aminicenantes bacterium]|nr:heparinase II/III-family protein [Candidatus Aminicenantes bacterium]
MRFRRSVPFAVLVLALVLSFPGPAPAGQAPGAKDLLMTRFPPDVLARTLLPAAEWHPFPRAGEREAWERLPDKVRTAQIRRAAARLGTPWETPRATLFLDFVRDGNRSRYEAVSFGRRGRLADAVLAECLEGQGRFLDEIADGVWTISEETYWGVPAHVGAQKRGPGLPDVTEPTVDLFAAETGMLLAWTDYLVGDRLASVSPLLRERIRHEVRRRILDVNLARDDFWWMGFGGQRLNNWTPWIASNWLAAALLLEDEAPRRVAAIHKILRVLDNFLNPYPRDGGCDEGPGYWDRAGGSLYDCLELLASASGGRLTVFEEPLIREIGLFIARAYIRDPYFINFADAAAKVGANASLIYRYGKSVKDEALTEFGAFLARRQMLGESAVGGSFGALGRVLPTLFRLDEILAAPPAEPLLRDVWLPDLQVMAARSAGGTTGGLYVAAKGGHNDESHNHNDVGNFIVYADGWPAIIDVGVETYTAKTFSSRRYEIWTMQSAYHNLPTVNGVMQKSGREFKARDVSYAADDDQAAFSLDIAGAYPEEARVRSWVRTVALNRGRDVVVRERYELEEAREPVRLSLMSWRAPRVVREGRIRLENPRGAPSKHALFIEYDGQMFQAEVETIPLEDDRLRRSWTTPLYRIRLTALRNLLQDDFQVRFTLGANE